MFVAIHESNGWVGGYLGVDSWSNRWGMTIVGWHVMGEWGGYEDMFGGILKGGVG